MKRKAVTKKAAGTRSSKQALPQIRTAAADSSSPDSTLLMGGLALVVLIVGDMVFLSLSVRFLRSA